MTSWERKRGWRGRLEEGRHCCSHLPETPEVPQASPALSYIPFKPACITPTYV